jgi:hypothetical protein
MLAYAAAGHIDDGGHRLRIPGADRLDLRDYFG